MAINIRPLSITAMLSSIKSFFQSQENNSKWKDLNTGAEGNFLMRLLANIVAVISSRVVIGRREQHHDTANFMSSQIALANDNGYPVFRGRNQRRTIQILASVTRTIPALSVIGFYENDYSIITLEQLTLVEGEITEPFQVVIGALREVQWTARTSSLKKFVRHEQGISEDYILYKQDDDVQVVVPTTTIAKDKIYGKYYIYTNPYKSITVEYLNNLPSAKEFAYNSDTLFTLRYVELDDMESIPFSQEMFNIGTLLNTLNIESYKPFEEIDDIKHNSPVYRETQNLIRSKADWRDMYKDALPAFKQVTFRALTPSYTQLSYIKDDYTLLTENEESSIKEKVEPGRYFGRPFPDVEHPEREVTTLDVTVGLVNDYYEEDDIKADVQNIINNMYESKFGQKINIYDIEEQLKQLSYIKYARVSLHTGKREPFGYYKRGDMITETATYEDIDGRVVEESKSYRCTAILGKTGSVEPDWNIPGEQLSPEQIETDYETTDNEIVWACYKRLITMDIAPWASDSTYAVGDFVYSEQLPNYMFKCIDIMSFSGSSVPDTTNVEIGDFVEDGGLLLVRIPDNNYQDRANSYPYRMGAGSNYSRFNFNGYSFEVVGHIGTASGTPNLSFTDALQELYVMPDSAGIEPGNIFLDGDFRNFISAGDTLQVSMNYKKKVPYEEISETNLVMNSVIDAKVEDFEDEENDGSGGTTIVNNTITNTNVNIDITSTLSFVSGYSGEEAPHVIDIAVGGIVEDFQLILRRIEDNPGLPLRQNSTTYSVADEFNISYTVEHDTVVKSFEVYGIVANGQELPESNSPTTSRDSETKQETTGTPGDGGGSEDTKDKNANWKELKRIKEEMEQIQKWIESEPSDTIKTPKDVIEFYKSLGDGSRFKEKELGLLENYYVQYNQYDEEQIYLHMKQFGSTRLEAVKELGDAKQLGKPISNAKCLKYYDSQTNELKYIDRYGYLQYPGRYDEDEQQVVYDNDLIFIDEYTPLSSTYAVQRELNDTKCTPVRVTSYFNGITDKVQYQQVEEPYVKTFTITATAVLYSSYPIADEETSAVSKQLTCIVPAASVQKYDKNSYINLSYSSTIDNRIKWSEIDDFENVLYDWNVYPKIEVNVDVKY